MKHLLLLLALLFVGQASQAQQLDTAGWCPAGAVWVYKTSTQVYSCFMKFTYTKDTTIRNRIVKKIEASEVCYFGTFPNGRNETLLAAEYEYLSNDSLYFYDPNNDTFLLKYTFNPIVGDSFIVSNPRSSCTGDPTIQSSDTLYVLNTTLDTVENLIFEAVEMDNVNHVWYIGNYLKNIGSLSCFHPEIRRAACSTSQATYGIMYDWLYYYQDSVRGSLGFFNNTGTNLDSVYQNIISSVVQSPHNYSTLNNTDNILLFPNPAKDWIWLDMEFTEPLSATIYSISGQVVKSFQLSQDGFSISPLPSGVYILAFQKDLKSYHTKFIKQ